MIFYQTIRAFGRDEKEFSGIKMVYNVELFKNTDFIVRKVAKYYEDNV